MLQAAGRLSSSFCARIIQKLSLYGTNPNHRKTNTSCANSGTCLFCWPVSAIRETYRTRDHILNSRQIRSFVWVRSVRLGVQ